MAYLIAKKLKGRTYYYIAEGARVNGKSRIVRQWYLGSINKLIEIAEGKTGQVKPKEVAVLEEGSVAALMREAQQLGIIDIINSLVPKRAQGMSVGHYILLAALNRAIDAQSKTRLQDWLKTTAVHRYMDIQWDKLSSQNFWDHFDLIDEKTVIAIGDAIGRKAVQEYGISLDSMIYDTTNYYNYWDVTTQSALAKMTKSKSGKNNLRHIGLALAVDREYGMPLFFRLYPANEHDSTVIKGFMDALFEQIRSCKSDKKSVTLVFDKGNNSEEFIERLDESRHHFIGSRSPYHHDDLCDIALERYGSIEVGDDKALPVYETMQELYGKQRRIVVTYNESTYWRKVLRLERAMEEAARAISGFKRKVKKADGRSTEDSLLRQAEEILEHWHVRACYSVEIINDNGYFKASVRKNQAAIEKAKKRFGKTILFTNRETLSTAEIVKLYRDRYIVEDAFRITKSDHFVKMDPAFHWTDSKIRVHALTCMIALLLVKLSHRRARTNGNEQGMETFMQELRGVRSALLYYPRAKNPERQVCTLTESQIVLLKQLDLNLKTG
ncbi:MAG: IS1634 family transposase [Nitrospirae bacterium]|nr:MAG: IS1634 family transposase [Nitrospirota bacterium]